MSKLTLQVTSDIQRLRDCGFMRVYSQLCNLGAVKFELNLKKLGK